MAVINKKDVLAVTVRDHFASFIQTRCAKKIHKQQGRDKIIVDYFDHDLPPETLAAQIISAHEALGVANFPGSVTIDYIDQKPKLVFEGREVLELLYQLGVRFDGDKDYETETIIGGPSLIRK